MKRIILPIVAATLLAACNSDKADYDATGTFEATEVTVSAEESGKLLSFTPTEGDTLSAFQLVGLVDTVQLALRAQQLGASRESLMNQRPDMQAQIASLRQEISKAELEVKRYRQLVNEGAANRKQLEDAESQLKVLRRQLTAQQSTLSNSTRSLTSQMSATEIQRAQVLDQLAKCHITSPISGTVLEKYVEPGEMVTTGKPLFKIADTRNLYLRAYIPSVQLSKVKVGQQVKVYADYGDNTRHEYSGRITWISQQSEFTPKSILTDDDRADQVYAVKVLIKNDGYVKIGMYGELKFL